MMSNSPARLPAIERLTAAKEREALFISRDGETIYKKVCNKWQKANWFNGEFGSWWEMGEVLPPAEVVVL